MDKFDFVLILLSFAFAMALGGGLDIRAGKHIDIRAAQVDYLPVFFSHKREDGLRFSAGVKIKD